MTIVELINQGPRFTKSPDLGRLSIAKLNYKDASTLSRFSVLTTKLETRRVAIRAAHRRYLRSAGLPFKSVR